MPLLHLTTLCAILKKISSTGTPVFFKMPKERNEGGGAKNLKRKGKFACLNVLNMEIVILILKMKDLNRFKIIDNDIKQKIYKFSFRTF